MKLPTLFATWRSGRLVGACRHSCDGARSEFTPFLSVPLLVTEPQRQQIKNPEYYQQRNKPPSRYSSFSSRNQTIHPLSFSFSPPTSSFPGQNLDKRPGQGTRLFLDRRLRSAQKRPFLIGKNGGEGGIRTPGTLIRGTHDFQSCTFNRSVTSPFRNVSTYERRPALQFSMSPKSFLADRLAIYQNGPLGAKMKWLEQRNPDFRARPGKSRTGAESLVRLISLNFFGF